MISKWYDLRGKAIDLRLHGRSIREVEKTLGIPRSTLSGWFKKVTLSEEQLKMLEANRVQSLVKARELASMWHYQQKELRLQKAKEEALAILSTLDISNKSLRELCLAMLYLGEGTKTTSGLGIGNSNPTILKFFINILVNQYKIDINKIKCSLHLRADQDPSKLQEYWSRELDIPTKNFTSFSIDKRTMGRKSYSTYHGVCVIHCGNIALQRRLLSLSKQFCEKIIEEKRAVSSAGRALS